MGSKMQRRLTELINRVWVDMTRQMFQDNVVITVRSRGAQPKLKQQESGARLEYSGQGLARCADLGGASPVQGEGEHGAVCTEGDVCCADGRLRPPRGRHPPEGDRGRI